MRGAVTGLQRAGDGAGFGRPFRRFAGEQQHVVDRRGELRPRVAATGRCSAPRLVRGHWRKIAVQYLQRRASCGISLMHSGQVFCASTGLPDSKRSDAMRNGTTMK